MTITFVTFLVAKYAFKVKIDDRVLYGNIALFMIISSFTKKFNAVEMFDGSSVAFDKEAFENLNRVVNEIAGQNQVTIPGNLTVQGNITVDGISTLKQNLTVNNNLLIKKNLAVDGTSTLKNNCTLMKKLSVNDVSTFGRGCIVKNNASVIIQGSGKLKLHNQEMKGDSTYGIVASRFLASKYLCEGGQTYIDKNLGISTNKKSKVNSLEVITSGDEINIASNGANTKEAGVRLLYDGDYKSKNNTGAHFDHSKDVSGNKGYQLKIRKHKGKGNNTPWGSFK